MKDIINLNNNVLSVNLKYMVEDYLTIDVKIKSGEFSGQNFFCISKNDIIKYIKILKKMETNLTGVCEITDYDSDSNIIFQMKELGHLDISGLIGGTHREQYTRFKFQSDQTILNTLIQTLQELIR